MLSVGLDSSEDVRQREGRRGCVWLGGCVHGCVRGERGGRLMFKKFTSLFRLGGAFRYLCALSQSWWGLSEMSHQRTHRSCWGVCGNLYVTQACPTAIPRQSRGLVSERRPLIGKEWLSSLPCYYSCKMKSFIYSSHGVFITMPQPS